MFEQEIGNKITLKENEPRKSLFFCNLDWAAIETRMSVLTKIKEGDWAMYVSISFRFRKPGKTMNARPRVRS